MRSPDLALPLDARDELRDHSHERQSLLTDAQPPETLPSLHAHCIQTLPERPACEAASTGETAAALSLQHQQHRHAFVVRALCVVISLLSCVLALLACALVRPDVTIWPRVAPTEAAAGSDGPSELLRLRSSLSSLYARMEQPLLSESWRDFVSSPDRICILTADTRPVEPLSERMNFWS